MIIWLYLRFSSITAVKSLKIFTVCEICLADHLKAEKKLGLQRKFHRYLQFCVFFLHLKFGLMNFF